MQTLAPRRADSNKGDFGKVLVIAGSPGMSGAAILAGSAALRGGAGLVRIATPCVIQPIVAGANPCAMTIGFDPDHPLDTLQQASQNQTVVAIGPGLGRSLRLDELVGALVTGLKQPLIVDADALNSLAPQVEKLDQAEGPRILTPHPGEFGRLLGIETRAVQADRESLAKRFANQHNCVVLLKGQGTIITDGQRLVINGTGNPGMAAGGMGDVLTGLTAALLAQGLAPFDATVLAAHIHGLAGDIARDEIGPVGILATDVVERIPKALRQIS